MAMGQYSHQRGHPGSPWLIFFISYTPKPLSAMGWSRFPILPSEQLTRLLLGYQNHITFLGNCVVLPWHFMDMNICWVWPSFCACEHAPVVINSCCTISSCRFTVDFVHQFNSTLGARQLLHNYCILCHFMLIKMCLLNRFIDWNCHFLITWDDYQCMVLVESANQPKIGRDT